MAEEKFLARWSRRKRAAAPHAPSRPTAPIEEGVRDAAENAAEPVEAPTSNAPQRLPQVDAIDGGTDIREFLAEGVPTALARAALRRAWASDPAIRDFVGLAENAWDFNAPDQIPGFGTMSADEVRRLLAQAKETGSASAEAPSLGARAAEPPPKDVANEDPTPASEKRVAANPSPAAQLETREPTQSAPAPPRHGGALPK